MEARREGGVHVLVEAHRADGQRVGQLREGVVVVVRRRRAALVVPRRRAHVERGAEFDDPRAQRVEAVPGGGGALVGQRRLDARHLHVGGAPCKAVGELVVAGAPRRGLGLGFGFGLGLGGG